MIATPDNQNGQSVLAATNPGGAPPPVTGTAGSPTPAPTPAQPSPAGGQSALGQDPSSFENEVPNAPPPGSFGSKLALALDKNPIPLKPNGKPVPGGWAASLVGATQHVLAGLGDAASGKAEAGSGILSGFSKAQANNTARVAQENQQKAAAEQRDKENDREDQRLSMDKQKHDLDMVQSNINFMHQQNLNYATGIVGPSVERGKKTVAMLTNPASGHASPIVAEDITGDDLKAGIKSGKYNMHEYTAFPTGTKPVGQNDQTGDPVLQTTYTLVNANGKIKPDADEIKYLNDNIATDHPLQDGQEFSFAQWNTLHQRADDTATQTAARNKQLVDAKLLTADQAEKLEKINFGPDWTNAMVNAHGDAVAARNAILANPALVKKYPNLQKDVFANYPGYDKLEEEDRTAKNKAKADAAKDAQDVSGVPLTDEMRANIASLPQDKQRVLSAAVKGDNTLAATLYSLSLNDGTLDIDHIFPNRKYKGSTQMDLTHGIGLIRELNPAFNEADYKSMTKQYAALLPNTKQGKAIESYNNVLQHAAGLQDTLMALATNNGPKFLNTPINKLKDAGWSSAPAEIRAAVEPLKTEFELLNSGGYKPSEDMQKQYDIILNADSRPSQIFSALKKIAVTGGVRMGSMDEGYYRLAGKHIPTLITPLSIAAARHLGLEKAEPQAWSQLLSLSTPGTIFQAGIPPESLRSIAPANKTITVAELPPGVPKNALSVVHDAKGNLTGYSLPGKRFVPIEGAK